MAVGCGAKCAKLLLIVFNAIFWLSGACVLAIGLWLLLDDDALKVFELAIEAQGDNTFKTACYILVGIGAFVFLVGFLGCCGAIRESKCLLGLYIFALVLVFIVELAAGILAALYKDTITNELKDKLTEAIHEKDYYDDKMEYTAWGLSVNFAQTKWGIPFPYTCCQLKDDLDADVEAKATAKEVKDWPGCQNQETGQFYDKPCYDQVKSWIEDNLVILIGVGIGIACLEILGLVFAICLIRAFGEEV